ncbi:MAG: lipoprotein-releasing ABC transporter permease subunit [Candidatus Schekmanbacteria bacterium]|nr:lipoprotein-releasing ABC transporter permease subunit [Candidatus Schekmanbacteria bacterium]
MLPYELFISLRYLKAKRKQTFISVISLISIAGVALGVAALIIVLAVMSGFEGNLRDKILGTNSHLVILKHNRQPVNNYYQVIKTIEKTEQVVAAAPFIYSQTMLSSQNNVSGVVLRGIDVEMEQRVTNLGKSIVEGSLKALVSPPGGDALPGIVIGQELAINLGAFAGDTLTIVSPTGAMTPMGMAPKMLKVQIAAIFNSGMYEYDTSLAYVTLKTAQKFFQMGDTVTGIELKVTDIYQADKIAGKIQKQLGFPYWARDWMEMNRNLFSALKLEKLAMFIILTLIVLVAAFNIIGTLTMMVMEKNKDIAILKSMGASAQSIMQIFMLEGLIIGAVGTVLGGVIGTITCWAADHYKLIKLQGDVYYMTHLPFKMQPLDVIIICSSAILISFLATLYPARQAAGLDPAESLRYE